MLALQMPWWVWVIALIFATVVTIIGWKRDDGNDEGGG